MDLLANLALGFGATIDGADGGRFLVALANLLENPERL